MSPGCLIASPMAGWFSDPSTDPSKNYSCRFLENIETDVIKLKGTKSVVLWYIQTTIYKSPPIHTLGGGLGRNKIPESVF